MINVDKNNFLGGMANNEPQLFVVTFKSQNLTTKIMDIFESYCIAKDLNEAQNKVLLTLKFNFSQLFEKGNANGGWVYQHHFVIKEQEIIKMFNKERGLIETPVTSPIIPTTPIVKPEPQPEPQKEKLLTPEQTEAFKKINEEKAEKKKKNNLMSEIIRKKDINLFHSNISQFKECEIHFINDKILSDK